jgi:hypothetical protein
MGKSKSKTFAKQSDFGDLMDFVADLIETEEQEIPHGGSEPALDVKTITSHKYIVTITKVEENG